jgi:nitrogenase molybdenum-iron protein alpha/beta subunit
MYTALHEYAHHLDASDKGGKLDKRPHGPAFKAILFRLLDRAEAVGVYRNAFDDSPELVALTQSIRNDLLLQNGQLLKAFGEKLIEASTLCEKLGLRFDDYIDRVLRVPRTSANQAIRMFQLDVNPALGPDNMRYVASIRDEDQREDAQKAILGGQNPDSVRQALKARNSDNKDEDPKARLQKEKERLERTIDTLEKRLAKINQELSL